MKKLFFILLVFSIPKIGHTQIAFEKWNNVPIYTTAGNQLKNAWAGGLYCPQFSEIDLNNDGKKDLFVFDRSNNKISCFLNLGSQGNINYAYHPEFESLFPKMENWALLRDFNGDGKMDIFCGNTEQVGIKIYKNTGSNGNNSFTLEKEIVNAQFGNFISPIYLIPIDLPSIIDVDGDGDLDILTFQSGSFSGDIVYLFKNYSKEDFGNLDSLNFKREKQCWGKFRESPDNCTVTLSDTNGACKTNSLTFNASDFHQKTNLHTGSSLLVFDANGDGLLDLMAGDIGCNKPYLLTNGGDNMDALFYEQTENYPPSHPINIPVFPAFYYVDVNNDGLKDLIAAPNIVNASLDTGNIWLYLNEGSNISPNFVFKSSRFLQNDMLDLGHAANPLLADVNKDGILDLLIGNFGYYQSSSNYKGTLAYLQNIGSKTIPNFMLLDLDYSKLSESGLNGIYPALLDVDKDGGDDLICGNANGDLYYFRNTSGTGSFPKYVLQEATYKNIDVGNFSRPSFCDINEDGFLDLLIGEKDHGLNWVADSSDGNYNFKLVKNNFGNFHFGPDDFFHGFASGYYGDINGDGNKELVYADKDGLIRIFKRDSNYLDSFVLIKTIDPLMGTNISMSLGDLDGDGKMDMILGSYAGGISLYKQIIGTGTSELNTKNNREFSIFPNPGGSVLNIKISTGNLFKDFVILDALGRELLKINSGKQTSLEIPCDNWPSGIYFIKDLSTSAVQKWIKY